MYNKMVITVLLALLAFAGPKAHGEVKFDDYCIVLVSSAECGYCIVNTAWFNSLADKYADKIQMVALNESDKKTIDQLAKQFPDREVTLRGWTLVPDAWSIYSPLIEQETYPQIILLKNGKAVERFVGTIQPVKDAVEEAIPKFVDEKYKSMEKH